MQKTWISVIKTQLPQIMFCITSYATNWIEHQNSKDGSTHHSAAVSILNEFNKQT